MIEMTPAPTSVGRALNATHTGLVSLLACFALSCVTQAQNPQPATEGSSATAAPVESEEEPEHETEAAIAPGVQTEPEADDVPDVDEERAFARLVELVELGNRYYDAPQRREALDYMRQQLEATCEVVREYEFEAREQVSGVTYTLTNIVGRYRPNATRRIILGSHFDTRLWAEEDADHERHDEPITGANDGSSGVAAIFEILAVLNEHPDLLPPDVGIDAVLFDGEEFGRPGNGDYCKGSEAFARDIRAIYPDALPEAAIVMDMVADRDFELRREGFSYGTARDLQDLVWEAGERVAPDVFSDQMLPRIFDDHVPLQRAGIPSVLMIDFDYPHWHTHQDTLDKCSPESLAITVTTVLHALQALAAQDVPR